MKLIHKDFKIYSLKNFYNPLFYHFNKSKIIDKVLENEKYLHRTCDSLSISYSIHEDYNDFFKKLYFKYYNLCYRKTKFTELPINKRICWAYVSDEKKYYEIWHNHINTSTINSVYYLNIPKGGTSIDFEKDGKFFSYTPNENELIIFPNHLFHKPNKCYGDGYRVSINMEITCFEEFDFLFP